MGTGYTRQSAADIADGENVVAAPLNAEFNALQSAFNSSTGHSHDGTSGEGPLINLTTSITGQLPVANGGIAAIHKINATTAPTTTDDTSAGYGPGSIWIDVTNDVAYVCLDATASNAVWDRISYNTSLDDIAALAKTDGNIIVGDGANWVAESGATARTSLGLAIGTDVQAYDAGLASIAGLTTVANKMIYTTGSDSYAVTDLTSFARTILDDTDAATARTTLGLAIGTNVQAYDAGLLSIAGLTTAADKMIYTTASDTYAVTALTSFARSILDDTDEATFKATVNLEIGTDVQAYDAQLSDIAGITYASGDILYYDGANIVNLAKGSDGQYLTLSSGAPSWSTISPYDESNVSITGGSISGITDLAVADGGTGASTAADARTNLGVAIGSDVQAYDADLAAIAGLTSAANKVPMFSGSGTATLIDFKDEDDMSSDSDTAVSSQQSVKAYVDARHKTLITTITPSSESSFDVTDLEDYEEIHVEFIGIVTSVTNSNNVSITLSSDNGSSFITSGYAGGAGDYAQATNYTGSFGVSSYPHTREINYGYYEIKNFNTVEKVGFVGQGFLKYSIGVGYATFSGGLYQTATAMDAIQIKVAAGNFGTQGKIKVYGIKNG